MSNRITAIVKTSTGWAYTTDISASHKFDVYDADGNLLLANQTGGTFAITTTDATPPLVSIDYSTDILLPYRLGAIVASNNIILQWLNMGAEAYHVEQYIDAEWQGRATVPGNELYLQYTTTQSGDTDTTWRVTPCEADGIEVAFTGQPVEFAIIHVGLPEPPPVVLTIADGTITVTESTRTTEINISGI